MLPLLYGVLLNLGQFIHEHSDGRSSFLNALQKALPVILNGLNIDSNILIKARADRSKDPILASLLKFPDERKPSRFPPVLFPSSIRNMNEAFTGAYFLMVCCSVTSRYFHDTLCRLIGSCTLGLDLLPQKPNPHST
jgi:hypothetical protein